MFKLKANYDESEDEEDVNLKLQGSTLLASAMLPNEDLMRLTNVQMNLPRFSQVALFDWQIKKSKVTERAAVAKDDVDGKNCASLMGVESKWDPAWGFVIYTIIYLIYPPRKLP